VSRFRVFEYRVSGFGAKKYSNEYFGYRLSQAARVSAYGTRILIFLIIISILSAISCLTISYHIISYQTYHMLTMSDISNDEANAIIIAEEDDQSSSDDDTTILRSEVWTFFKKVIHSDGSVTHVKCNLCLNNLAFDTSHASTSNMKKHLNSLHRTDEKVKASGLLKLRHNKKRKISGHTTTSGNKASLSNWVVSTPRIKISTALEKDITLLILKTCCEVNLSFRSLSESINFQQLMSRAVPGYSIPSRTKLRSLLDIHYGSIVNKLVSLLSNIDSIALTTDSTDDEDDEDDEEEGDDDNMDDINEQKAVAT